MQLKVIYASGRVEIIFKGDLAVLDRKIMAFIRDSIGENLFLDIELRNDEGRSMILRNLKIEDLHANWVDLRETYKEWGYSG